MSGSVLAAFGIWMLLTAEFSWLNAAIGLAVSLVVAALQLYRFSAGQLLRLTAEVLLRLPLAFGEAVLMVVLPHRFSRTISVSLKDRDKAWSVFCRAFLITLTPRSLVTEESEGTLRVHVVERRKKP